MNGNLVYTCVIAFSWVFLLLAVLAGVMKALIAIFPQTAEEAKKSIISKAPVNGSVDASVVVAITTAFASACPGAKVTKIEEIH